MQGRRSAGLMRSDYWILESLQYLSNISPHAQEKSTEAFGLSA
jgi:hypothetical protein